MKRSWMVWYYNRLAGYVVAPDALTARDIARNKYGRNAFVELSWWEAT